MPAKTEQFKQLTADTSPVLVLMNDPHLGNFVLSLPVIEAFGRYFTGRVDVLVTRPYLPLVRLLPNAERFTFWVEEPGKKRRKPKHMLAFLRHWARSVGRYRAIINMCGGIRNATMSLMMAAPRRVGWLEARRSRVYTDTIGRYSRGPHAFDFYRALLRCTHDADLEAPSLKAPADAVASCERILKEHEGFSSHPFAVIHAGAGKVYRIWPEERFVNVANELTDRHGLHVIWIGAPGEETVLERQRAAMRHPEKAMVFVQPLTVLLALFERARILVSNESGPTHLAATTDVPIVTLFGPTDSERWGPKREHDLHLIQGPRCADSCAGEHCELGFKCIMEISVEEVLSAVDGVLS